MLFKISIIIVTYNNYETTTKDCLKSLLADDTNKDVEIIVVDNNSQDKTPEMLEKIALENKNVEIILNSTNRGFAGGNNDGVAQANGDILVLLNSDTIVPVNGITQLASRLFKSDSWAMLGPVTNEAGNEQKIYLERTDEQGIIKEGQAWCLHSNGDCFESQRLDFCCVAIKKSVYRTLDGLDEAFGMGYYEDTDFSLKALAKGYKMGFTERVFIYHKAGKSFVSHGGKKVKKLMKANKKLLKKKHAHSLKLHHIRDCNLRVLNEYTCLVKEGKGSESCENIRYRFRRRLWLAKTFFPNNPFKKLKYSIALWSVTRQFRRVFNG